MDQKNKKSKFEALRQKAEDSLKKNNSNINIPYSEFDKIKLIHELQVHQIELEVQKEELEQATERAETASDKYSELYDFAPIGYITLSKEGKITQLNLAGAKLLGNERSRLINKMFSLFISDETKPVYYLFLSQLFESDDNQNCEVTLKTNESSTLHINLTGVVAPNGDQGMVTLADITQQKKSEQSLAESEEKFRRLFEEDLTGNFIINGKGILLDCNQSFLDIFGYVDKLEIIGKSITFFYNDESEFEFIKTELKKHKILKDYETIRKCKNGDLINIIENKVAQFNSDGEIIEIKGYLYDNTARKKAENELKIKNQELEKLIVQKDKFFSIIAHDLRGPFNGFLGLTEIIAKELSSLETDEIQKMGETMWRSATNLFKLLENLLQWSQMEQGLIPFNPGVFRLLSFAEENLTTEFQTAENKEIQVTFDIPIDIYVLADAQMLRSLLSNLCSNATKFTPKGGNITISARYSDVDRVEISIKDSGIGMNKDIQSKLFQLSEQINRQGTDGELSTGLGLFLCKEFIEKHNGIIWVESEEGKGSTFSFTIPSIP